MIHTILVLVSAAAANSGTAAVLPLCDSLSLTEAAAWATVALTEQGWQVVSVAEGSRPNPCDEHSRNWLKKTFQEARVLFEEQLRHEAAQLKLAEAAQAFDRHQTLFDSPGLYAKVHFFLGWIALEAGRRDEVREHFARVAQAIPDWRPNSRRFPPRVVAAFAQVSSRVQAAHCRLNVDVKPAGSEVWVDGNKRCETPCKLDGLPAGTHFLAVRRDGFASLLQRLEIEPEATSVVATELVRDPREQLATLLRNQDQAGAIELSRELGPGAVVLLAPAPTPDQVSLTATGDALTTTRGWVIAGKREAVVGVVRSLGPPPPGSEVGGVAGESRLGWLLSQWWFWAAVGVGAATTGVVVGVSADRDVHFTVRP